MLDPSNATLLQTCYADSSSLSSNTVDAKLYIDNDTNEYFIIVSTNSRYSSGLASANNPIYTQINSESIYTNIRYIKFESKIVFIRDFFKQMSGLYGLIVGESQTYLPSYMSLYLAQNWLIIPPSVTTVYDYVFYKYKPILYFTGDNNITSVSTTGNGNYASAEKYFYSATYKQGYWHYNSDNLPEIWAEPAQSTIKYYDTDSFVDATVNYYDGTSFVECDVYYYDI